MKVLIASDHAGFGLKAKVISYLNELGIEHEDLGAFEHDALDDYPDFISPAAQAVSNDPENTRAIILGGSGEGEAMVANRFPNVRATVYYGEPTHIEGEDLSIIKLSREHNNANVLSLGARFIDEEIMKRAVKEWLETPFTNDERHQRRIEKLG